MCIYCCYGNWSITRVTGMGGGVLIKLERPLYLEKSLPYGTVEKKFTIWHILYY